jgi:hypothetical protein
MRPYSEVYTLYECQSIRGQFRGAGGLGNPGLGMPVQKQLAEKLQRLAASHVVRRIQQLGVLCKHLEPAKYLEYTGEIARTTSATKTAHRFEVLVVFEERRRARLVPSKNLLQKQSIPTTAFVRALVRSFPVLIRQQRPKGLTAHITVPALRAQRTGLKGRKRIGRHVEDGIVHEREQRK